MEYYGITDLIDLRGRLVRNPAGGPQARLPVGAKSGVVLHWNGPLVSRETVDMLLFDAEYHAYTVDWSTEYGIQHGDGIMYHVGFDPQNGQRYLLRDFEDCLWHCAEGWRNYHALAFAVPIGQSRDGSVVQRASADCLASIAEACDQWLDYAGGARATHVWGHQEVTPNTCPGSLMADFIYPYRRGAFDLATQEAVMADHLYFPETKQSIGGGFKHYWETKGGLPIFGYPISPERQEDGRTTQYFERAVFEYHPENQPPFRVLLRRLGAEALAARDG